MEKKLKRCKEKSSRPVPVQTCQGHIFKIDGWKTKIVEFSRWKKSKTILRGQLTNLRCTVSVKQILKYYFAITVLFLTCFTWSVQSTPPDQAYNFKTATWNMQGAGSGVGDSKWEHVKTILKKVEVITLQESGTLPDSTIDTLQTRDGTFTVTEVAPWGCSKEKDPVDVHEVEWNIGSTSRPLRGYIYQLEMGTRLNMATVSRYKADEVYILPASLGTNSTCRPIIGIRIGNSAFFNIHAAAIGGGNEAPGQVIAIENAILNYSIPVSSWMILGDYNRSPNSLVNSALLMANRAPHAFFRQIIYDQSLFATQQSGNILDYAILGLRHPLSKTVTLMKAEIMNIKFSDHSPVSVLPM